LASLTFGFEWSYSSSVGAVGASGVVGVERSFLSERIKATISASGKKNKLKMKYPQKLCPLPLAMLAGSNAINT
jgi:hypothetical protein